MCSLKKKKNGTTFSIENTQCLSTDVAPSHWAVSIEGCLPSCAGTPSVQETAGFFRFIDKTYVYKVLPFVLVDSSWVFLRVVATVLAHLRLQGICFFFFLGDWLCVAEVQSLLQSHLLATL